MPFWGLYLQQRSFSAEEIGILLALFSSVRIFAPNLWAALTHWLAHKWQAIQFMRLGAVFMLLCFSGIYWVEDFWPLAILMLCYGFFWSAILPQYETLTLDHIRDNLDLYSNIRLWGSVGFIIIVSLLGWAFDYISISYLPLIMLLLMLLICLNGFSLPPAQGHLSSAKHAVDKPAFPKVTTAMASFLVITLLLQISHGPYYVFFSIHLQQLDYDNWAIGLFWSLGVIAEIVIFWRFAFFTQRFSLRELVILSLILTAIRWLVTAYFAHNSLLLFFSQCLHAFSFGLLHAVSINYLALFFPGKQQLHGQAIYSGIGFGLGGAVGAFLAGLAWLELGADWVFVAAAGVALIAAVIAYLGLPREKEIG
jgi:PPP family 3-phenylpropionic acid transporter